MNKHYIKAVTIVIMVLGIAGSWKLAGYILDNSYDSEEAVAKYIASEDVEEYTINTEKVVVKITIEIDFVEPKEIEEDEINGTINCLEESSKSDKTWQSAAFRWLLAFHKQLVI